MILVAEELAYAAVEEARSGVLPRPALERVCGAISDAVAEAGFVAVRGLPVKDQHGRVLEAVAGCLGRPYVDPAIGEFAIPAEVGLGQHLMGNQARRLPLHTDYSMLPEPPTATLSCCVAADPTAGRGTVSVADLESSWYGMEKSSDFQFLTEILFPFAGGDKLTRAPLLTSNPRGIACRYHPSRLAAGFRIEGGPTAQQLRALRLFLATVPAAEEVALAPADILVIDNHRCLHARGACSVRLTTSATSGRRMVFGFLSSFNTPSL